MEVSLVVVCRPSALVGFRLRVTLLRGAGFLAVSRAMAVVTPTATVALTGPVVTILEPRSALREARAVLCLLLRLAARPLTSLTC